MWVSLQQNPGVPQIQLCKKYTFCLCFSSVIPKYAHFLYFLFLKPKPDGRFLLNMTGFFWISRNTRDFQVFLFPLDCFGLVWALGVLKRRGSEEGRSQGVSPSVFDWGGSHRYLRPLTCWWCGTDSPRHSLQSGWVVPSILPTQGTAAPSTVSLSSLGPDGCSSSVFGTSVIRTLC